MLYLIDRKRGLFNDFGLLFLKNGCIDFMGETEEAIVHYLKTQEGHKQSNVQRWREGEAPSKHNVTLVSARIYAKGKFEDVDVKEVIKRIHEADINVMGNYIFGLPGDTKETMKKTFDLSVELCTAGWNT